MSIEEDLDQTISDLFNEMVIRPKTKKTPLPNSFPLGDEKKMLFLKKKFSQRAEAIVKPIKEAINEIGITEFTIVGGLAVAVMADENNFNVTKGQQLFTDVDIYVSQGVFNLIKDSKLFLVRGQDLIAETSLKTGHKLQVMNLGKNKIESIVAGFDLSLTQVFITISGEIMTRFCTESAEGMSPMKIVRIDPRTYERIGKYLQRYPELTIELNGDQFSKLKIELPVAPQESTESIPKQDVKPPLKRFQKLDI